MVRDAIVDEKNGYCLCLGIFTSIKFNCITRERNNANLYFSFDYYPGGVGTGCGNIYFTGNGDLMTGSAAAEELGISAASLQSVNRAPSTFWQYSSI